MKLGISAAVVDGVLLRGDVEIAGGKVVAVGVNGGRGGGIAIPGLVDLQVNGFGGVDFAAADASGYRRAGEALLECGVTAFQPTLITAPEADLVAALAEIPSDPIGPRVIGAHLEGPFLSPLRLGAHRPEGRRDPDRALLARLLEAGPVSQVTLAPELDGALELIRFLALRGVLVAGGHSNATAREAHLGFDAGATTVTHLFNAMRPLRHRDPGIAGVALARDDVVVQLIVDGRHLADESVRLVWRAAAGRTALVSDATATVTEDVLTGGAATLLQCVRNLHALGVPFADAVDAATAVPARLLGRPLGTLETGSDADVVVLDDGLEIRRVLVGGVDVI